MKRTDGKRRCRRRQFSILILTFGLAWPLSGCWNNVELNKVRMATAVGIDLDEKGRYLMTVQVVKPVEGQGGGQEPQKEKGGKDKFAVFQASGYTMFDAARNMIAHTGFKLFYDHLQYIALGHELAERDIIGPLDFFMRNRQPRMDLWILIADKRAESVIKVPSIMHPLQSVEVDETMKSGRSIGRYPAVNMITLMRMLSDKDKAGYLPRIRIVVNEQKYVHVAGAAMIQGGRVIGDLDERETRGLMWVRKEIVSTIVVVPLDKPGHYAAIETLRSKANIKSSYDGKRLRMKVTVKPTGNIGELESPYPLTPQTFKTLEAKQNHIIKEEIQMAIEKAQEKKADIFGFEEVVHRAYPQEWKRWKTKWPDIFGKLPVTVEVDSRLLQNGLQSEQLRFRGE